MNNRKAISIEAYCDACINILEHVDMIRHNDQSNMVKGMIKNFNGLKRDNVNHAGCLTNIRGLMGFDLDPGLTSCEKKLINHALDNIELMMNEKKILNAKSGAFSESTSDLEMRNELLKSRILDKDTLNSVWTTFKKEMIDEDLRTNPVHILGIKSPKPLVTKVNKSAIKAGEIKKNVEEKSAVLAKKFHEGRDIKKTGVTDFGILRERAKHRLSPRSANEPIPNEKRKKNK